MEIILKYFPEIDEDKLSQFNDLKSIYAYWNKKINVISRKDMDNFYERHVLHSLAIAKAIKFLPGTKILDVGTGGGFPGIPLSILFPEAKFILVDSIEKKIKVVNAVIRDLKLTNVKPVNLRAEQIKETFDFVVSRAVTKFENFLPWVEKKINKLSLNDIDNGILYLKGGDVLSELKAINCKSKSTIFPISNYFIEDFFSSKLIVHIPIL